MCAKKLNTDHMLDIHHTSLSKCILSTTAENVNHTTFHTLCVRTTKAVALLTAVTGHNVIALTSSFSGLRRRWISCMCHAGVNVNSSHDSIDSS